MAPLISVIIPVYNVESYLRTCVDSVLAQTYADLEIILVDDGSPDNCGNICDDYARLDSRIKVIHKENGGLSSARNTGLQCASGSYIGFVDSDDIIDKEMYEVLYAIMERTDADISMCRFVRFEHEEDIAPYTDNSINCSTNTEALYNYFTPQYVQTVVCVNKLYKRHLFDGIEFPLGFINEDEFITHQLIYRARKITDTEREMYYYRKNPTSIMHAPFSAKRLDAVKALQERIGLYESEGLTELAHLTEYHYAFLLIRYYFAAKVQHQMKKHAFHLWKEFRDNHVRFLHNPTFSKYERIRLSLFKLSPLAYSIVTKVRR